MVFTLISTPPHISQPIELIVLYMPVSKASFYHVLLLIGILNPTKTSNKHISAMKNDRKLILRLMYSANDDEAEFCQSE